MASDKVDTGFAAEKLQRDLHKRKVSEHDCLSVQLDTKRCLVAVCLEKCPLNYLLARNLNWIVPDFICHKPDMCITHLKQCLFLPSESGHVEVRNCVMT